MIKTAPIGKRWIATLCVVIAVLFASVFAPAHATVMAFPPSVEHSEPCPMTGQPMVHHHDEAPVDDVASKPGDMACCPAPALNTDARSVSVFRLGVAHKMPHLCDSRASLVALPVDPGVPRS